MHLSRQVSTLHKPHTHALARVRAVPYDAKESNLTYVLFSLNPRHYPYYYFFLAQVSAAQTNWKRI